MTIIKEKYTRGKETLTLEGIIRDGYNGFNDTINLSTNRINLINNGWIKNDN